MMLQCNISNISVQLVGFISIRIYYSIQLTVPSIPFVTYVNTFVSAVIEHQDQLGMQNYKYSKTWL
jgi:hypothetical protein